MNTFKRKSLFTAVIAAVAVAVLPGCGAFGAPRMDAEQLKAVAKDKNASVACATYDSLPVDGAVLYINIDQAVVKNGQLTVRCGASLVQFTNTQSPFQVTAP